VLVEYSYHLAKDTWTFPLDMIPVPFEPTEIETNPAAPTEDVRMEESESSDEEHAFVFGKSPVSQKVGGGPKQPRKVVRMEEPESSDEEHAFVFGRSPVSRKAGGGPKQLQVAGPSRRSKGGVVRKAVNRKEGE
jgi:hypothetical protein